MKLRSARVDCIEWTEANKKSLLHRRWQRTDLFHCSPRLVQVKGEFDSIACELHIGDPVRTKEQCSGRKVFFGELKVRTSSAWVVKYHCSEATVSNGTCRLKPDWPPTTSHSSSHIEQKYSPDNHVPADIKYCNIRQGRLPIRADSRYWNTRYGSRSSETASRESRHFQKKKKILLIIIDFANSIEIIIII